MLERSSDALSAPNLAKHIAAVLNIVLDYFTHHQHTTRCHGTHGQPVIVDL
jgi:hypothetical protein